MEIAELILKYIEILVWPGVALGIVLVFRLELREVIRRLETATLPGGIVFKLADLSQLEVEENLATVRLREVKDQIAKGAVPPHEAAQLEAERRRIDESLENLSRVRIQNLETWGIRQQLDRDIAAYRNLARMLYKSSKERAGLEPKPKDLAELLAVELLKDTKFLHILHRSPYTRTSMYPVFASAAARYLIDRLWPEITASP